MDKQELIFTTFALLVLIFCCVVISGTIVSSNRPIGERVIKVSLIEYKTNEYIVWDKEGYAYYVDETLFRRYRITKSDQWIQEGRTYRVVIQGHHSKLFKTTPTIISYTQISEN